MTAEDALLLGILMQPDDPAPGSSTPIGCSTRTTRAPIGFAKAVSCLPHRPTAPGAAPSTETSDASWNSRGTPGRKWTAWF